MSHVAATCDTWLLRVPVFPRPGLAGDGDAVHHAEPDLGGRPLGGGRGLVTHGEVVAHDEVPGLVVKVSTKVRNIWENVPNRWRHHV